MEVEQMFARLINEIRADRAEMKEERKAFGDRTSALIAGMKDGQKEAVACQEETVESRECKDQGPKDMNPKRNVNWSLQKRSQGNLRERRSGPGANV
jgi:hypothetical protein